MLRSILTVGGWTMVSRVLGLMREMLIAALLGTGPVADAFFVALKLPNLFRRLFGEGAFNAAFVPSFSGILATEGPVVGKRFAEETLSVLALWLLALTLLGEVFMPQLMVVLAPGFEAYPAKFALTVTLSRITFPYLLLICLAALVAGVLNGLDRFGVATASYVLFNLMSMAAMVGLTPYLPNAGYALSWGVTAAGVAQLALLFWEVRRAGMSLWPRRLRLTPQIRALLRRMMPGLIGGGVTQINFAVDVIIMSLLPAGSVAILNYADRINQLPLGVIGAAVSTALLPRLSREVRSGDPEAAADTINRALEYALFLALPAALALLVVPRPIVSVLFERGRFGAESALLSSQSLAAYAVGLPAFVLVKVLSPGFFARGDTSTPVRIGFAVIVLNFALNLAFMAPLRHMGPALASSLAAIVNMVWLGTVLRRRGHLTFDRRLVARFGRLVAATAGMGVVLWLGERLVYAPLEGLRDLRAVGFVVMLGLAAGSYFLLGQVLGAFDVRDVLQPLLRRRAKVATGG